MKQLISCEFNIDTACVDFTSLMRARFLLTALPLRMKWPITAFRDRNWIG